MHRGQLIIRCTVKFSEWQNPNEKPSPTCFSVSGEMKDDTFCVSAGSECNNIRQARKFIDKILDGGIYHYGI